MMYLRDEDLESSNQDVRELIQRAIPADGVPALMLARDILAGAAPHYLDRMVILIAPSFNPDGNERISARNRFLDSHTHNGSYQQEPITWTWGLNPNGDPGILEYMATTMLPAITHRMNEGYGTLSLPHGCLIAVPEEAVLAKPLRHGVAVELLLEPESDDGLVVWNFFDRYLSTQFGGGGGEVPVHRLLAPAHLVTVGVR